MVRSEMEIKAAIEQVGRLIVDRDFNCDPTAVASMRAVLSMLYWCICQPDMAFLQELRQAAGLPPLAGADWCYVCDRPKNDCACTNAS